MESLVFRLASAHRTLVRPHERTTIRIFFYEYLRGTPLHCAVSFNHAHCVELLLAHRADPRALSMDGETPSQLAERIGLEPLSRRLREAERVFSSESDKLWQRPPAAAKAHRTVG